MSTETRLIDNALDVMAKVQASPLTADQRWEVETLFDPWFCRECRLVFNGCDEESSAAQRGEFPDEMLCPDCGRDAEPARDL